MAAQPRNIIVTVVDDSGDPLQSATVTLISGGNSQVLTSDANGQCTFPNLPPGQYKLLIAREGFNTRAASVTLTDVADADVRVEMKVIDVETVAAERSRFFMFLTGLQYTFLGVLAIVFAIILIMGIYRSPVDLSNKEAARGMITYVVSVVTVAIGMFLVVGAAFLSGSKDLEKRFAFGKDVFTVLVGVLGTVMGFYYGQTGTGGAGGANANTNANAQPPAAQTLQISTPQANPSTPRINTNFTVTADISGGEAPYKYTITFTDPNAVTGPAATDVESTDGKINRTFTVANVSTIANKPVGFTIKASDKDKKKEGTNDKGTFTPAAAAPGP